VRRFEQDRRGLQGGRVVSGLEPRGGARMTRKQREQHAYRLALATGGLSVVAVAGLVLAVLGIVGASLPILAAVLAVVSFILFRRTVGG